MDQQPDKPIPGADKYQQLLAEAVKIKGVPLWKDAWRRLRKNVLAMVSLVVLITIVLLSIFTPLLPLQSPTELFLKQRKDLPPNIEPIGLGLADIAREVDKEINALQSQLADADDAEAKEIQKQIDAQKEKYDNRVLELWHKPNWFDRKLIRLRLAIFDDWCIPSVCGTDNLGRDLLARLFWGSRVSLIVGIVATLVSLIIGVSYGAIAGYFGGRIDNLMMRFVDVLYSIPFIFVVIFIITILDEPKLKEGLSKVGINKIVIFYIVIGAIYWLTMARVVRGQVLSLKNEQFIEAARTIGASQLRIIFVHLVPNLLSVVIVYLTLTIPSVMLFEAFLSFLGLGVAPPDVSWGMLANDGIRVITPIKTFWWLVVFPGLALGLTLFALNFLGDGLRDALDPRMKNK